MEDLPQPPSPQMVMLMGMGGALGFEDVVDAPRGRTPAPVEAPPADEGILLRGRRACVVTVDGFVRPPDEVWRPVESVERWDREKGWFWLEEEGVVGMRMECLRVTEKISFEVVAARLSVVFPLRRGERKGAEVKETSGVEKEKRGIQWGEREQCAARSGAL